MHCEILLSFNGYLINVCAFKTITLNKLISIFKYFYFLFIFNKDTQITHSWQQGRNMSDAMKFGGIYNATVLI